MSSQGEPQTDDAHGPGKYLLGCLVLVVIALGASMSSCAAETDAERAERIDRQYEEKFGKKPSVPTDKAAEPAVDDEIVKRRVERALDFAAADEYLVQRVRVTDGDVTIVTGIGADDDGAQRAGGICAEVWGIAGEEAPADVESVVILGEDRFGNEAEVLSC